MGFSVRVYPGLLQVARRKGHPGPLRLWTLARALDTKGRGLVAPDELREAATHYMSRATVYRALRDGERLGFWQTITLDDGQRLLRLTGLLQLARAQGLPNVGHQAAEVPGKCLTSVARLRAAHYAALVTDHATHTPTIAKLNKAIGHVRKKASLATDPTERQNYAKLEKRLKAGRRFAPPISRRVLSDLGAPSRRTQSRYDHVLVEISPRLRLTSSHNMRRLGLPADQLNHARETIHGSCFNYGAVVYQRLPDTYSSNLPRVGKCRAEETNRQLETLENCAPGDRKRRKIFYASEKQAERATQDGMKLIPGPRAYQGTRIWRDWTPPPPVEEPEPPRPPTVHQVMVYRADELVLTVTAGERVSQK